MKLINEDGGNMHMVVLVDKQGSLTWSEPMSPALAPSLYSALLTSIPGTAYTFWMSKLMFLLLNKEYWLEAMSAYSHIHLRLIKVPIGVLGDVGHYIVL